MSSVQDRWCLCKLIHRGWRGYGRKQVPYKVEGQFLNLDFITLIRCLWCYFGIKSSQNSHLFTTHSINSLCFHLHNGCISANSMNPSPLIFPSDHRYVCVCMWCMYVHSDASSVCVSQFSQLNFSASQVCSKIALTPNSVPAPLNVYALFNSRHGNNVLFLSFVHSSLFLFVLSFCFFDCPAEQVGAQVCM